MRRSFAISPNTEQAIARGDAFWTLGYAARLRMHATTGKARRRMDHRAAIQHAAWANDAWKRCGGKLP